MRFMGKFVTVVGIVAALFVFQNCESGMEVSKSPADSVSKAWNGTPYEGKPYVLIDQNCPSEGSVRIRVLYVDDNRAYLETNDCKPVDPPIALDGSQFNVPPQTPNLMNYNGHVLQAEDAIPVPTVPPPPPPEAACPDLPATTVRLNQAYALVGRNADPGYYSWGVYFAQYETYRTAIGCIADSPPDFYASSCVADCTYSVTRDCNGVIKRMNVVSCQSAQATNFIPGSWASAPSCQWASFDFTGQVCL